MPGKDPLIGKTQRPSLQTRRFAVYRIDGAIRHLVREVEARTPLEAIVAVIPPNLKRRDVAGYCWRGEKFFARVRLEPDGPWQTLMAEPCARRSAGG